MDRLAGRLAPVQVLYGMRILWIVIVSAVAASAARVIHYEVTYTNDWVKNASAISGNSEVRFTLVLREQGIERLKRIALDVNDPASDAYGAFLTQAELENLTSPAEASVAAVTSWLRDEGVQFHFRTASNVDVVTSAHKASQMLRTQFHEIRHRNSDLSIVRAGDFSVPSAVHEAVAAVFGLHGLPLPRTESLIISSSGPSRAAKVTPEVITSTYNISGVKITGGLKNRQAVAEFQRQYMNSQDLSRLFKKYMHNYKVGTDDVVYKYVGAPQTTGDSVEADLDIQYIMAPAVGIKTEFWEFPDMNFCSAINQWSSHLASTNDVPLVHSISYGLQNNLTTFLHCRDDDIAAVETNFAKIAAKGISILISSGDAGSGCQRVPNGVGWELWPSWPASSPWVTAVGATRFIGQKVGAEEMAADSFGSGGGFSKQFSQDPHAQWQERAVAAYLSSVDPSTLPPAGSFPPKGRATPDVAALGEGYQVVVHGKVQHVGGTSASTPAFAAMVSLLNEARINAGKPQMGFLNPFLYSNADAFFDVTVGSNRGMDPYGFNCSKGWDPVTGLGTPKFDRLLAAAMAVHIPTYP